MAVAYDRFLNESYFLEPEVSRQRKFAGMGILNPTREDFHPSKNARIYRFGHSGLTDEENLSSPWWMDFQNFVTIRGFAETNQTSLTIANRIHNAVDHSFGPADVLITAELQAPLRVFQGLGRPIAGEPIEKDGKIVRAGLMFFPPRTVTQTFIPGLRNWKDRTRSEIGKAAFRNFKKEAITSGAISLYGE